MFLYDLKMFFCGCEVDKMESFVILLMENVNWCPRILVKNAKRKRK